MDDSIVFATWRDVHHIYTCFFGTIRVHNQNGISNGSAVCAGLTTVTDKRIDKQTDPATPSIIIGRIYVVMRWA